MHYSDWPEAHTSRFRELMLQANLSFKQISETLNRELGSNYSRNAVIGKAKRLGLSKEPAKRELVVRKPRAAAVKVKLPSKPIYKKIELPPVCEEVVSEGVSIYDVTGCRYPYGDDVITFCNNPRHSETSYCGYHYRLIVRK